MMETNRFNMVDLNFTLQCQHFYIFLCYQWFGYRGYWHVDNPTHLKIHISYCHMV